MDMNYTQWGMISLQLTWVLLYLYIVHRFSLSNGWKVLAILPAALTALGILFQAFNQVGTSYWRTGLAISVLK